MVRALSTTCAAVRNSPPPMWNAVPVPRSVTAWNVAANTAGTDCAKSQDAGADWARPASGTAANANATATDAASAMRAGVMPPPARLRAALYDGRRQGARTAEGGGCGSG